MRQIDADALKADFENRARKARNWKEHAIMARDEEIVIRATATLDFIYEVIMTIDRAPAVDLNAELDQAIKVIKDTCKQNKTCVGCPMNFNCNKYPAEWTEKGGKS